MRLHRLGAVLALSLASLGAREVGTAATCSVPAFGAGVPYPGAGFSIAAGDFNEDGHPDIAGAYRSSESTSVNVLFGTGTGAFGAPLEMPTTQFSWDVVVADLNVDGHDDIVTVGNIGGTETNTIEVLLGSGTGTFTRSSSPVGFSAIDFRAADFTGDGVPDLALPDFEGESLHVFPGDGAGGFGPPTTTALPSGPLYIAAGDLNGDGDLDVVASVGDGVSPDGTVVVLLGDGAGGFGLTGSIPMETPPSLALGDLDGDHRPDLVTVVIVGDDSIVAIRAGNGTGGFGSPAPIPLPGRWAAGAHVSDFNGDGLADIAIPAAHLTPTRSLRNKFDVLLGDGHGGFGPVKSFALGGGFVFDSLVADFDSDGRVDLAATDIFSETADVSILMNMCGNVADLAVSVSDSADPATLGTDVTYTVLVTNHGPDPSGVGLDTTVPAGVLMKSFTATSGSCAWEDTIGLVHCELGNLAGTAPGNTATFTMVVTPDAPGTLTSTSTVTATVVDPDSANDSEEETTLVAVLGGHDLTIRAAVGGGAALSWTAGNLQAGYFVGRIADGVTTIFPPGGAPLPAGTTGFVDPSPVAGEANCYTVAPVDASGQPYGLSELVCLIPNTASPSGAPVSFSLRLDGQLAHFTWAHPGGQTAYALYAYPLNGTPSRRRIINGASTGFAESTGGVPTCFVLVAANGATALGNTDALCAVPGVSTLP
jgi:uncharacterized repeat protein (TIGR01451 family)